MYKTVKPTPIDIANIRILLGKRSQSSAKLMFDAGAIEEIRIVTGDASFDVRKVASTGNFDKDYQITKRVIDKELMSKPIKFIFCDDLGGEDVQDA